MIPDNIEFEIKTDKDHGFIVYELEMPPTGEELSLVRALILPEPPRDRITNELVVFGICSTLSNLYYVDGLACILEDKVLAPKSDPIFWQILGSCKK